MITRRLPSLFALSGAAIALLCSTAPAFGDEPAHPPGDATPTTARTIEHTHEHGQSIAGLQLDWDGYTRVVYRHVQQAKDLQLVGRTNGFELGDARIGVDARFGETLVARLSIEAASEERRGQNLPSGRLFARARDAYVTWAPAHALQVSAGQMISPFSIDAMRSSGQLPFVRRSVSTEGVQPGEGLVAQGMLVDRNLGVALHSGDILLGTGKSSVRWGVLFGNGNGQNESLNDNNALGVFGRVEYSHWGAHRKPEPYIGPMRARSARAKPIFNLGLGGLWNKRSVGDLPDLLSETDIGAAADLGFNAKGIDVEAGGQYIKTTYSSLPSQVPQERLGWWAHVLYTIPGLGFDLVPGYRIASYAPRAHLMEGKDIASAAKAYDESLALLYHTIGVMARPLHGLPVELKLNYTIASENKERAIDNNRLEAEALVRF